MKYEMLEQLVIGEIAQKEQEGFDVTKAKKAFGKIKGKSCANLRKTLEILSESQLRPDFRYKEPSDLSSIRADRVEGPREMGLELSDDEMLDKIYGGWLGRCAGCLLGKPVEGGSKEQIEEWLEITNAYPLENYFPLIPHLPEDASDWIRRKISRPNTEAQLLGHIDHMVRDDDIDYAILNLAVLETSGLGFTTADIGRVWLESIPYLKVYAAGRAAYRNLVNGLVPPETAIYMNHFRESLGGQIRADIWGYVTPGMPELGAEQGHRDARLSQTKNGIYGEMFVSAMISAAFATDEIEEIIKTGLSEIPKQSRLVEAIRNVMTWSEKYSDWKDCWKKIMERYGFHYMNHSINNGAIVAMGLLYGEGNYEKSITITVMGGLDTDCNGATVGSILGVSSGAKSLPEKWIGPLNNLTESYARGFNNSQISDLAKRTFRLTIER